MLTTEEKKILDFLIPLFKSGKDMIMFNLISENTGISLYETDVALRHLESEDYLSNKRFKNGGFVYRLSHKALHYKDFESASSQPTSQTNIFNAPVTGSAIGNSGNITINNGMSYNEVMQIINSKTDISDSDKAEAKEVIKYIENITSIDAPLPKSFLSRFSDTLSKHSWLPSLIGNLLIRYFIG